ncbi:MAG: signal peptidase II [Chloroherpetonaceae bacterium]|nr:signal peptidase II [Chthonomonadaceae bacterium]MDW8208082.1 signal peptidase II [Chloroherpetonaceae bacterium]
MSTPSVPRSDGAPVRALRPFAFYLIVALVYVADQASKHWVQRLLAWEQSRPVFGEAFVLTLTRNTGGAWGILPRGNTLFIVFAVFAVIALAVAYYRMPQLDLHVGTAFALALGGALGNLTDRVRYGYVVDFFNARFINWPVFNVADSAISLGIVLLAWHLIRTARQEARARPEDPGEAEVT